MAVISIFLTNQIYYIMGRLDAKLLSSLRRSHDRRGRGDGDGEIGGAI